MALLLIFSFITLLVLFPLFFGWLIGGHLFALLLSGLFLILCLIDFLFSHRFFFNRLTPSKIQILDTHFFLIEDPSSHLLITQPPCQKAPILWITKGTLSLLPQENLEDLIRSISPSHLSLISRWSLRFESYLTTLLLRIERFLPREHTAASPLKTATSLPFIGLASILSFFYLKKTNLFQLPRVAIVPLVQESFSCTPAFSPLLSSHSIVNPWPGALICWTRPCLL